MSVADDFKKTGFTQTDKTPLPFLSAVDENTKPAIEWDELMAITGCVEIARQIIPVSVAGMRDQLEQLVRAIPQRDWEQIKKSAHSIKGAAANIAARSLSQAAYRLEHAAAQNELSDAEERLENVQAQFEKLESFLAQPDWSNKARQTTPHS